MAQGKRVSRRREVARSGAGGVEANSRDPDARPWWAGPGPLAALAAVVAVAAVGAWLIGRPASPPPAPAPVTSAAADQAIALATGTDLAAGARVGSGGIANPFKGSAPAPLKTAEGRVRVVYIGAEFCPYCAAQRWALVVALSRFGTWSGLELTRSSSTDAYPDTPTFSFRNAALVSSAVAFEGVEIADRSGNRLANPDPDQANLMAQHDPQGSIPFVDAGGRWTVGGSYLPGNMAGLDWQQVASQVAAASDPLARQVLGTANWYTAAICRAGADAPAACSNRDIASLESQLGG